MTNKLEMIERRADMSKLNVHLTRDNTNTHGEDGAPARDNFLSILQDCEIRARQAHSLYAAKVPLLYRKSFHVSCFTETPLTQINRLARHINGRRIQLEPWGFAFNREFMIENGAHPVTYVNSYPANDPVREAYDEIFESAVNLKFRKDRWKVLPFISAIQPGYDFGWEREVRIRGPLKFEHSDIVCAIVPENVGVDIRQKLAKLAIPMYTPGWSLERFVIESRSQQQRVLRVATAKPLARPIRRVAAGS